MYILHVFFVVIGAIAYIPDVIRIGPAAFAMVAVMYIGVAITIFVGKLLKIELEQIIIGSQAAKGGPSTAVAVAMARNWPEMVPVGILTGLLGYAIGTYLGFAVAFLVKAIVF